MKQIYFLFAALLSFVLPLKSQDYLVPEAGHKVAYHFSDTFSIQSFEVGEQYFYFDDGDTIYQMDPFVGGNTNKYGLPADYTVASYPSFLSLSSDGTTLWAGYTDVSNADARIYSLDTETGTWDLMARMPANWELQSWNDSLLVSGLNSSSYNEPNAIFVLDTSGLDLHRKIIETGGNSAGFAIDSHGNLYYGTSFPAGPNALYRWDSASLAAVIETPGATPLELANAEKLSDLPMGAYDCEVDEGDHVIFTMNVWGGEQVLATWNGTSGSGFNYETLAVSDAWLGMVKTRGDYTIQVPGNSIFTIGYDEPLADLHTADYPPIQTKALPLLSGMEGSSLSPLDLTDYFTDLDDPTGMTFTASLLSVAEVANFTVTEDVLGGNFGSSGQANLVIEATSDGRSVMGKTLVAAWPEPVGEFRISGFEDLNLEAESYWNGSDGSEKFSSGLARFYNDYNSDFGSWSGWSYSNVTDTLTAGFMNQYSAITGGGFEGNVSQGNYGVSSLYGASVFDFNLDKAHALEGFFVTNSTYAALSMKEGDAFAKKFGGDDGSDPDFFKLNIWGRHDGSSTDTLEFYLADFRDDNSDMDYLIETWQWVDLSSLGKVDSLLFGLESSDMGAWGMNTPAYFCVDDLYVYPDMAPVVANPLPDVEVEKNATDMPVDLSQVFEDPDDPEAPMGLSVKSNNNENLVATLINGDQLSLSFTADKIGEAEVVIEGSSMGLAVTDTFKVSVLAPTGLAPDNAVSLSVYPNPTTGVFRISTGTDKAVELKVFSLTGSLVHKNATYVSGETIDLKALPSGTYLVRLEGQRGIWTERLIKY